MADEEGRRLRASWVAAGEVLGPASDAQLGVPDDVAARIDAHLAVLDAKARVAIDVKTDAGERTPWFCSGCPHNTSTRVPEGSRALAGIGCHFMTLWVDRATSSFSQMGGEGVAWVAQRPFTTDTHVFANLGDGTYCHSGLLAIRQAIVAAGPATLAVIRSGGTFVALNSHATPTAAFVHDPSGNFSWAAVRQPLPPTWANRTWACSMPSRWPATKRRLNGAATAPTI